MTNPETLASPQELSETEIDVEAKTIQAGIKHEKVDAQYEEYLSGDGQDASAQERENERLFLLAKNAESCARKAHKRLVEGTVPYVDLFRIRSSDTNSSPGVSTDDIEQVSYLALVAAAWAYDPNSREKFKEFALGRMRNSRLKYRRDNNSSISVPVNYHSIDLGTLDAPRTEHEELDPSQSEIGLLARHQAANAVGAVSLDEMIDRSNVDLTNGEDIPEDRIHSLITELGDGVDDPESQFDVQVYQLLKGLKPRVSLIIADRYGILDGKPKTLEETGKIYGFSRMRASLIINRALKDLRFNTAIDFSADPTSPVGERVKTHGVEPGEVAEYFNGLRENKKSFLA